MSDAEFDTWNVGRSYENYMGRWSRKIARRFIDRMAPPRDADWLEIGCGTGALTETVLSEARPRSILATDRSADFVAHAQARIDDDRARFETAEATRLPCPDGSADIVTSALVFNFIPDRPAALAEMRRVLRPGGMIAFYVWDYPGGGIGFIDTFWKAAADLDPAAAELDEGARFPFCTPGGLARICRDAGLPDPEVDAIEVAARFEDFEAFWHPFTLGAGPAPGYVQSLPDEGRLRLRDHLAARLGTDGPLSFPARAWAVTARWPAAD